MYVKTSIVTLRSFTLAHNDHFWYVIRIMVFPFGGPALRLIWTTLPPDPVQMTEGLLYWTATKMWLRQI
jgi:hypothetical protein